MAIASVDAITQAEWDQRMVDGSLGRCGSRTPSQPPLERGGAGPVIVNRFCLPHAIALTTPWDRSRRADRLIPKPRCHYRESGNLVCWSWDSRFRGNDAVIGAAN